MGVLIELCLRDIQVVNPGCWQNSAVPLTFVFQLVHHKSGRRISHARTHHLKKERFATKSLTSCLFPTQSTTYDITLCSIHPFHP